VSALAFAVLDARAEPFAAVPTMSFRVRITDDSGEGVHAIALHTQLRIEPQRRSYSNGEKDQLLELFGEPQRYGETLKTMLWTHVSIMVPEFFQSIEVDIPVTCTYDFEVSASKYFSALQDGHIPVLLLFSGTIFRYREDGFAVQQVPWELDASYRLPVAVWRDVMNRYFPNSAWLRLHKDTFDELYLFKSKRALPSWESAISALLESAKETS
jgi:hypothetical protein